MVDMITNFISVHELVHSGHCCQHGNYVDELREIFYKDGPIYAMCAIIKYEI